MRLMALVLLAGIAPFALVGCGDEANGGSGDRPEADSPSSTDPSKVESSPPSTDPTAECAGLIPDAVLTALGWPVAEPAGESAGRCKRQSENSTLIVERLGSVAPGEGQAERAKKAYDLGCADLNSSGAAPEDSPSWLGPDVTACYKGLPTDKNMGFAELMLLTEDDNVVHIQASVTRKTTDAQLQAGLSLLVEQAEAAY